MPVALRNIRDTLLPGLRQMQVELQHHQEQWAALMLNDNLYANQFASKTDDQTFTLDEIHQAEDEIEAALYR